MINGPNSTAFSIPAFNASWKLYFPNISFPSAFNPIKLYLVDLFPYNNFLFIITVSTSMFPEPTPFGSANPPALIPPTALCFFTISLSFEPLPLLSSVY